MPSIAAVSCEDSQRDAMFAGELPMFTKLLRRYLDEVSRGNTNMLYNSMF